MHLQEFKDSIVLDLTNPWTRSLLLISTVFILIYATQKWTSLRNRVRPSTPSPDTATDSLKQSQRPYGQWTPSTFRTPTPTPFPDWSIETTRPLPYRPFRYGPRYNVTMGIRTVQFQDWIELDNEYPTFHSQKASRIATRGDKCCRTAPEAHDAALELLQELAAYLPSRYPTLFQRTEKTLTNLYSNETFPLDPSSLAEDPIRTCARLIQDDLAILLENSDGEYQLLSGAILLPGFWRLEDKFGMTLSSIHTSGSVPQFRSKLEKGMNNLFRRLRPDQLVARYNYFIQIDDKLPWSVSIGPEDTNELGSWATASDATEISQLHFRSERQTLRRLPRSGAIVFTIRTYFLPVATLVQEKGVPGRLAAAVRSWSDDVAEYKGRHRYEAVLLPFLDREHEAQVERFGAEEMERVEREWSGYPF